MILNNENYFSKEAMKEYLSVSQFKDFMGTLGKTGCEAMAMAKLKGEWGEEKTTPLLVGSYVDSHFEGTLDIFQAKNPELFTKAGALKSDFKKAEEIIQFIERDPLFMDYMSGEKQVIMTGEIEGAKFKIKIDSYLKDKAIVDLKVMASLTKKEWVKDFGKMSFIEYWGYDIQGAVYQEIVRQNTGVKLPFYIAGTSKEKIPNKEIIWIDDKRLEESLLFVKQNIPKVLALKNGELEPLRCGHCDYCRFTKMLEKPIHYSELEEDI